jgi:hypothetical protein
MGGAPGAPSPRWQPLAPLGWSIFHIGRTREAGTRAREHDGTPVFGRSRRRVRLPARIAVAAQTGDAPADEAPLRRALAAGRRVVHVPPFLHAPDDRGDAFLGNGRGRAPRRPGRPAPAVHPYRPWKTPSPCRLGRRNPWRRWRPGLAMFLWDRRRRTAGRCHVTARRVRERFAPTTLARPTTAPVARLPVQSLKRPHPEESNSGEDEAGDAADDPLNGHPRPRPARAAAVASRRPRHAPALALA